MRNKLLWAGIIAVLIGVGAAFFWRTPLALLNEQTETDRQLQAIREKLAEPVRRAEIIYRETSERVVEIRAKVVEGVRFLSADAVADRLNSELELWRMDSRAGGVDDS